MKDFTKGLCTQKTRTYQSATYAIHIALLGDSPMTPKSEKIRTGKIYVGIGGWTFEPWRGVFYPKGLPHAKELGYASERLTSIEVNGTFYRSQTPATFRKWASEVPPDFVFCAQGPALCGQPARAQRSRRLDQAFSQFRRDRTRRPSRPAAVAIRADQKIRSGRLRGFLELLPGTFDGRALRHVIEVRHDSFGTPEFVSLLRKFAMPAVHRSRDIPEHRRYYRRFRLCPPATRARIKSRLPIRRKRSPAGRRA